MTEAAENDLVNNLAISPNDFHDCIPRISEVALVDLDVPSDLQTRLADECGDLLLPDGFLEECAAALITGSLVLQGPPGTGKSSLARALAKAFNVELFSVTAHEDWATYEVIGRQELRVIGGKEEIVPVNGHFTEAVIQCAGQIPKNQDDPDSPQATWLLIDELNRAHADKAFGELFSVLGSNEAVEVVLGYQREDNNRLRVPRRFRIIATVNSIDKQFVNSLSQGLRRRFTFLTLDVPPKRPPGESWATGSSLASEEYRAVLRSAIARAALDIGVNQHHLTTYVESDEVRELLAALFAIVENVRYATDDSQFPFIPVGTAPLIDTVQLFLVRWSVAGESGGPAAIDWAASVKLAPLFEAASLNRNKLQALAASLAAPFDGATRRALLAIESDGLYYVS